MDASIVGINGPGVDPASKAKIIRHCWSLTRQELEKLDPRPKHIILIGKGVERALDNEIERLGIEHSLIPQPQAHIVGGFLDQFHKCFEICSKYLN